jgi:filamentous hemagglutinin
MNRSLFLAFVALCAFGLQPAWVQAQVVPSAAGSGSKPIVGVTASGMPVVQIATPNGAGVSNNKYTAFNVGTQGLILNNSSTNVLTQQAGYITGNPNLTANGAQVILNQVLGGNASQLLGYMEVAGQKADVIVANPAGITCNGCGFINANRGVLTTGTPVFGGSGSLDAFHVTGGQIQIGSSGLNANNTDQVDLIARSVQANGKVWANKAINAVAGTNDVQYGNLATTALTPDANHPTVAIDVAQLGGMYAGKIALVGTEAGVGVNSSGPIAAQSGDVTVNSQGQVTLAGATSASGNVSVNSAAGIVNTGAVYAAQNATLTSQGQVGNSGTVAALGNTTVNAASVDSTGTLGAGVDTSGNATGSGSLSVSATGTVTATGTNLAGGDAALSGSSLNMTGGKTLAGGNATLTAASGDIDSGSITAEGNLTAIASGALNNSGGTLAAGGTLSTQSNTLTNTGTIVGGSATLSAAQSILNQGPAALIGTTSTTGTLAVLAPTITNIDSSTTTDSAPTTSIYGLGTVVLAGGKDANGNYANANQITNSSGLIQSAGDMMVAANRVTNTRTTMQTSSSTSVDSSLLTAQGISLAGCTAIDMNACSSGNPEVGGFPVTDPAFATMVGGAPIDPPHGGHWNSTYQYTTYTGAVTSANVVSAISPQGQIISGGNLDAGAVGNFQNYWSAVTAVGNVTMPQLLDQNSWQGQTAPHVTVSYSGEYHYDNYNNEEYNWQLPFGDAGFVTSNPGGYSAAPADVHTYALPSFESTFTANGTISGTGVAINNVAGNAGVTPLGLPASGKSITVPQGGLFNVDSAPNAPYLIQTNPAFADQQTWLSSDYYFEQMGMDPAKIQMRLGDGYYEQQMVQQQILSLTGKSLLTNYASTQAEYEALMTSGAQLAKSLDLAPGTGLSPAQVAQLTSNVVIMQTEVVNGQSVLVPVVYLAQANQQNMGNGPVIAATDVDLQNVASMTNSGTIAASNNLTLSAQAIDSTNGTLAAGNQMALASTGDVNLTSATVNAGSLNLQTGGNLILDTATKTLNQVGAGGATRTTTTLGPAASINVTNDATITTAGNFEQNAGNLNVGGALGMNIGGNWTMGAQQTGETKTATLANGTSATHLAVDTGSQVNVGGASQIAVGGDLTASGAQINLGGGGTLAAQGNVNLLAATATTTLDSHSSGGDYADTRHTSDDTVTGTSLISGNDLTLAAGKDLNVIGSGVNLTQGTATLAAQGNVNLGAAAETHVFDALDSGSHSGFLSSSSHASMNDIAETLADGSAISADTVNILAGKNLAIQGSSVVGTKAVDLAATGNVDIEAATNTLEQSSFAEEHSSGLMGSGGLGLTIGSSDQKEQYNGSSAIQSQSRSTVGAVQGNVSISAGQDVHVLGSDIVAGKAATDTTGATGNISITGQNVTIDPGQDSAQSQDQQASHSSGFTIGLTGTPFDTVRNLQANASSGSAFARMQGIGNELTASAFDTPSVSLSYSSNSSSGTSNVSSTTYTGSSVRGGGNVSVIATGGAVKDANGNPLDGDITVTGSTVTAGGTATFQANRNVTFQASTDQLQQDSQSSTSSTGFSLATPSLGDQIRWISGGSNSAGTSPSPYNASRGNASGNAAQTQQTATVVTGNSVVVKSDTGDIGVIGSGLSGTQGVSLVATKGAINVLAGTNTDANDQQSNSSQIGSLGSNGTGTGYSVGVSHSSQSQDTAAQTQSTIRSQIVSSNGNVGLTANQDVTVQGADLSAGKDLTLVGQNVNLLPGSDATQSSASQSASQYGVTLALGGTIGNAVATVNQMMAQSAASKDPRLAGLQTVQAGLAAYGAYQAATANGASSPALIKVSVSVGGGSSRSDAQNSTATVAGSTLAAGNTATVVATGSGAKDANGNALDGDINAAGAQIGAQDVTLNAARDVNLLSAQSTTQDTSSNSGSNASIGIGASLGGTQNGFTLDLAASGSKGNANGDSVQNVNTQVLGANSVSITSGRDTSLIGAQATGNTVDVVAGRNLTITSPQDSNNYNSQQASAGLQMSLCVPPFCYGQTVSGSVSASDQRINSNFLSVGQQSGIYAGSGGFDVNVGNHTQLNGGVVASSDSAVLSGLNSLTTGTLGYGDLQNHAAYSGQQIDLAGGYAGGAHGQVSSTVLSASGSEDSVTRSAIGGGALTVTNSTGQQQLTGQTATQAESGISRDTSNTAGTLAAIFDKNEVQDRFQIADLAISQVKTFVSIEAARADTAKAEANDPSLTPEQRAAAQQQADQINAEWGPGGTYRQVLTALTVAAGGNVTGGLGEFAQNAAVAYFQELGANGIKQIITEIGDDGTPQGEAARSAMQAIVGCAGAAASSQSCSAGAMGAAASSALGSLLGPTDGLSATQKQARENAVESMVAAIAAGGDLNAATAVGAGQIEAENNQLALPLPTLGSGALAGLSSWSQRSPGSTNSSQDALNQALGNGQSSQTPNQTIASEIQGYLHDITESLFPNPGEPPQTSPPLTGTPSDENTTNPIPGQSADTVDPIAVPGQSADQSQSGVQTTTTPMPDQGGPTLIYQQGNGSDTQAGNQATTDSAAQTLADLGYTENGISHIFDDKHLLDPLVNQFGSQENALLVMQNAAEQVVSAETYQTGSWVSIQVGSVSVAVKGAFVNGTFRISTATMRPF